MEAVMEELEKKKLNRLQEVISEREAERTAYIQKRYNEYENPLTPDIEEDENSLINAYELFSAVDQLNKSTGDKGDKSTKIRYFEISSVICRKAEYTDLNSDSFLFLRLWFIKRNPEAAFVPELARNEKGDFYLDFSERELWKPSAAEKEILQSLEEAPSDS